MFRESHNIMLKSEFFTIIYVLFTLFEVSCLHSPSDQNSTPGQLSTLESTETNQLMDESGKNCSCDGILTKIIRRSNHSNSGENGKVQFPNVPEGEPMLFPGLQLDQEIAIYRVFSAIVDYLQPDGFPLDVIRSAWNQNVSFHVLVFQLLKLEFSTLVWIFTWATVIMAFPFVLIAHYCCSKKNMERLLDDDDSTSFANIFTRKILTCLLHICLLVILCPTILMLSANEKLYKSIKGSPSTLSTVYHDLETLVKNTHLQMSFVVATSTDIAIQAIGKQLDDSEGLLGEPFQKDLAAESGLDEALTTLAELEQLSMKVEKLVSEILQDCISARVSANSLQAQLLNISGQLGAIIQQCSPQDLVLCYTLQSNGLDVLFTSDNLTSDLFIKQFQSGGTVMNLNLSINGVRNLYNDIPHNIVLNLTPHILDIRNTLSRRREDVYKSVRSLDELSGSLQESLFNGKNATLKVAQVAADWQLWIWLLILVVSIAVALSWALLLCGAPCGCGLEGRGSWLLLSGVGTSCLACLLLWMLGTLAFIIGSHAVTLICQPLHDHPGYSTLGRLVDSGGVAFGDEGVFGQFGPGLEVWKVLRSSRRNEAAYMTFNLHQFLDIKAVTNYRTWADLRTSLCNFTNWIEEIEIFTPSLNLNLEALHFSASRSNLTAYRSVLSGPLTRKDLDSFADQINSISRQLNNFDTSRRLDRLVLTCRKVVQCEVKKLKELRNDLLYKLTALEVSRKPLILLADKSLEQLKAVQFFVKEDGRSIAEKNYKRYICGIEEILEELYKHIERQVVEKIGKCRPLWEIFHWCRFYVDHLIVDPVNAIAVSSFSLILLFLITAPVVVKLLEQVTGENDNMSTYSTHRRARNQVIIDDEGTWVTPDSESPEVPMQHFNTNRNEDADTLWASPGPRMPQIPSISVRKNGNSAGKKRAARIRESLRLVEPLRWKSGPLSPRSWL